MATPDIYERRTVDVLTPELKQLTKQYSPLHQFVMIGCTRGRRLCRARGRAEHRTPPQG